MKSIQSGARLKLRMMLAGLTGMAGLTLFVSTALKSAIEHKDPMASPTPVHSDARASNSNESTVSSTMEIPLSATGDSLNRLLSMVADETSGERTFAIALALGNAGPQAEAQLIAAFRGAKESGQIRTLATALALNGSENAVEAIWQAALTTSDPATRKILLDAFDNLTNPDGVSLLASSLASNGDADVVEASLRTVARAATSDTVAFLGELYTDPGRSPAMRSQIVEAVSMIANESAVPGLGIIARRFDAPEIAEAAATGLAKSGLAQAVIELANAYQAAVNAGPAAASLRQAVLEAFQGSRTTEDNIAAISLQAEQFPIAEWRTAARALVERHEGK